MTRVSVESYLNVQVTLLEDTAGVGRVARAQYVVLYWVRPVASAQWIFHTWVITGPEVGMTGQQVNECSIYRETPDWLAELIDRTDPNKNP